ncbi:MAG: LTA synthase family protein, partial [Clostridia bacterium]|nr:LTA synthase family protein [Clostridia bacterium]
SAPNAPSSPDAQTPQPPNGIMVQLESVFDVKRLSGKVFSEDPVPNFTALKEAYPSGYLTVPSIGAGTANTEFEVLTGMNLYDFGAGEYPYKTILRSSTCESLAYSMRALGASAFALHNNSGTFYERHRIYSSLGFDTFVPLEHMHDVTSNPLGWAKDAVLTPEILTCMDTTAGTDFVFAVSVQPHGKYPDDTTEPEKDNAYDLPSIFDRFFDQSAEDGERVGHSSGNVTSGQTKEEGEAMRISVSGIDNPSLSAQYTYYVNQLYETDLFIGELISALSAREEDTVLVLYGDHLPCFNYTAEDMADSSSPYQTEYVIWSNFDTNTADRDLHAYQLSAYTQMAAGLCEGTLTRLHQSYLSTEEDASAEDTAITAKEAYLSVLELLEYDMLYGDQILWDGCNPYLPSDLQYGVRQIRIHSISVQEQTVYIHGENFTPFSSVLVNDNAKSTKFIDSTLLKITLSGLRSGDSFRIVQCGVDRIPLGGSDVFLYAEPSSEDAPK